MGKVFYPRSNKKMKSHPQKTSSRRKYGIRSMPVRKDDEVLVVRGKFKTSAGKVNQVYRKRWCIYIEGLSKTKSNGTPIRVPIHPSNCVLTKLKLDKDRESLISRKAQNNDKAKGKVQAKDVKK